MVMHEAMEERRDEVGASLYLEPFGGVIPPTFQRFNVCLLRRGIDAAVLECEETRTSLELDISIGRWVWERELLKRAQPSRPLP